MFSLFSFEDEDLGKIRKTILILSSLILVGWGYGLSIDLGKIAVITSDTERKISIYVFLTPFLIYFLLRLCVTAWWTHPKLKLSYKELSQNSDDIISTLNGELKDFHKKVDYLRNMIEPAIVAHNQITIKSLPDLDEYISDTKALYSFERLGADASPSQGTIENRQKIIEKYPPGFIFANNSLISNLHRSLADNHESLRHLTGSWRQVGSTLDNEGKKVITALARFSTSAKTVVDRQLVDFWLFGVGVPAISGLAALIIPLICP